MRCKTEREVEVRAAVVLVGLALLSGCSTAQDLLGDRLDGGLDGAIGDVRTRADDLIARGQELGRTFDWCAGAAELGQAVFAGDVEAARVAAEELRITAPEDLTADLRVVAEAAARAQVGDPRVFLEADVRDATRNVHAYAVDLCGLPGRSG